MKVKFLHSKPSVTNAFAQLFISTLVSYIFVTWKCVPKSLYRSFLFKETGCHQAPKGTAARHNPALDKTQRFRSKG